MTDKAMRNVEALKLDIQEMMALQASTVRANEALQAEVAELKRALADMRAARQSAEASFQEATRKLENRVKTLNETLASLRQ